MDQFQKTMILPFAKIGFFIGGAVSLILGLVVNSELTTVYETTQKISLLSQIFVFLYIFSFGFIFGAVSGMLVGIGTPQAVVKRSGS